MSDITLIEGAAAATPAASKVAIYAKADGLVYSKDDAGTETQMSNAAASGDMVLADVQTVTGAKTFGSAGAVGKLKVAGTTSGATTLDTSAVAGTAVVTIPAVTDTLVGKATTDTLTNKRITNRVSTAADAATLTPASDDVDIAELTAQAQALTIANPTGTPTNGQGLLIKITDNGTARALSYGTQYRACGVAKATTTTLGKTMYIPCIWDSADSKWDTFQAQVEI